jgi:hypothetical protein
MKTVLVVLFTLTSASHVYAQHPDWLDEAIRVDDPDELAYWTAIQTDCPLTVDEVENVIEGVLSGNQIKPLKHRIFEDGRIYLNVNLRCTKVVSGDQHAFSIDIHFGRYQPWPAILFDAPYAYFGIGGKDLIMRNCKERVAAAIAAFAKANTMIVSKR